MKIENRFFKIEIHAEWKAGNKLILKRAFSILLLLTLTASMLFYDYNMQIFPVSNQIGSDNNAQNAVKESISHADSTEESDNFLTDADYITSAYLASVVQEKYADKDMPYTYGIISTASLTTEQVHEFPHSDNFFFCSRCWNGLGKYWNPLSCNICRFKYR